MFKVVVTNYHGGEGIEVIEYNYIDKYYFEEGYLVLEDNTNEIKTYIKKEQVLDFDIYY